jgi:hypothetical protein
MIGTLQSCPALMCCAGSRWGRPRCAVCQKSQRSLVRIKCCAQHVQDPKLTDPRQQPSCVASVGKHITSACHCIQRAGTAASRQSSNPDRSTELAFCNVSHHVDAAGSASPCHQGARSCAVRHGGLRRLVAHSHSGVIRSLGNFPGCSPGGRQSRHRMAEMWSSKHRARYVAAATRAARCWWPQALRAPCGCAPCRGGRRAYHLGRGCSARLQQQQLELRPAPLASCCCGCRCSCSSTAAATVLLLLLLLLHSSTRDTPVHKPSTHSLAPRGAGSSNTCAQALQRRALPRAEASAAAR